MPFEQPIFLSKEQADALGIKASRPIPVIQAQATVLYPKALEIARLDDLDVDTKEWDALISVRQLFPFIAVWVGDTDALVNWIKTNEALGSYKLVRSADGRSIWAWMLEKDAKYFCGKFGAVDVTRFDITAIRG
jgi:hypothetical protein